jgi:alkylhydroperoxidase family enzyme
MPRLEQVPKSDAHESAQNIYTMLFGEQDPVRGPGTATGTPGNWWTVFAGSPDIFDHAVAGFQLYRSPKRKLDPKLRELGQTRAGWARGSQFVFSQHCKAARSVGLSDEKIAAIPHWQIAQCFAPIERAVLAYTDALVYDGGRVADGIFAALKAVISRALRLEYDDVDDRVVDIAAPSSASADVMAMVDKRRE